MNGRLKRLETMIKQYQGTQYFSVFILEDGSTFTTKEDPLSYLVSHGTDTPIGKIVSYPYPTEGVDALSLSIYESINDEIKTGAFRLLVEEMNHGK